jgi:hypothetical protein
MIDRIVEWINTYFEILVIIMFIILITFQIIRWIL